MKIRLSVLVGELILGVLGYMLIQAGHPEGAIGIAGVIGATMDKLMEKTL